MERPARLITVTRQDLSHGYQTVQTAHAVAEFAFHFPTSFKRWRIESKYLITLAVKDKQALEDLIQSLDDQSINYVSFYETDVNEITAIALEPSILADKATSSIPLANRKSGSKDKHN